MNNSKRPKNDAPASICADEVAFWRLAEGYRRVALRELGRHWSHTLAQPISSVHNYFGAASAALEARERADDAIAELLHHIGDQTERVVQCLMTLRSHLPELLVARRTVDLNALTRAAVQQTATKLADRGVALQWSLAPEPLYGTGDATLLTQALINLIVNAFEAMDATAREGRRLSLISRREADEAWISVGDTGPGIPQELAQQVFEPLFSTKPAALGMGLPVARAIAEAHEGYLRLAQASVPGARFRFSLPLR